MEPNLIEQGRRQATTANNKKILFIICIYLFLTISSKYSQQNVHIGSILKDKLLIGATQVKLSDLADGFQLDQSYEGQWLKGNRDGEPSSNNYLSQNGGMFQMKLTKLAKKSTDYGYKLQLTIFNGEYIDKGILSYEISLQSEDFYSERTDKSQLILFLKKNTTVQGVYHQEQILLKINQGKNQIQALNFTFSLRPDRSLQVDFVLDSLQTQLYMHIQGQNHKMMKMMIFAVVMFITAYFPFTAIMSILKGLYQGRDNPRKYSLITICLTNMWDTVLCLLSFVFAFKDQQSLMLFIVPAFLLCLLFTNLQPRFMIMVYQSSSDNTINLRELLCKFNIIHYGTLLFTYPILMFTNLNWILFISMSCIIFPQIYTNGLSGHRPQLDADFYLKYLLGRFVLIFYLKCCPFNVFNLQPDFFLSFLCFTLIVIQYCLLFIQKIYGSKKVIPQFLLQPVFNYKLQYQINIEQGIQAKQCSICLNDLHIDPPKNPNQLEFQPKFKLMCTPCKHYYHSHCLMVWMKIKMECPQCRAKLPPYQ